MWVTGSYDAALNQTYWGVGNAGPDWNADQRPGDNLYTDSVVALDADTGRLKWHYQFTPHDRYDYDSVQVPVLADVTWRGTPIKAMVWANRNGNFYVLDRETGRFLVGDVLDLEPDETYDYVVASGLFGLDSQGARERIRPTMDRIFSWSRIGAAMNFLSGRSPTPAEQRIYIDPLKALEAGFALTDALRLNHAYLPNDFTLYLYKVPAWQDERRMSRS